MLEEGMMIASRYKIINKIGAGGMSDVYKAIDTLIERDVAIKILKQEYSEDANFLRKFQTEARAAGVLQNPNIVNVYDVGSENKLHYIVMEYVEGITLKTYIEKCEKISVKETIAIAIQVANGIRAAHNKGIIHRDIKPQNIMVSIDGKAKVTDFGIARATTSNTINSDVMGSVHYTSPEQARNGFVDAKSDIYSLGIVMYEMVTGRVPFDGDSAVSVALQHLQEEIVRPSAYVPDLPISLENIILKCTQKSPDRRYHNMDELLTDLKRAAKNPDEDFVVIDATPTKTSQSTRVMTKEEVDKINEVVSSGENSDYTPAREKAKDMRKEFDDDDDDDDDEKPLLSPKWEKIVTIGGIVLAGIIIILIILVVGTLMDWFSLGTKKNNTDSDNTKTEEESGKIKVPKLVGLTMDEAQELANSLNIGIRLIGTEASEDFEEGQIMSQSIEEGEYVEEHTTIDVIVCTGTKGFEIPTVENMTETEATTLLQGDPYFLVVSVAYEYSDSVEAEHVIKTIPSKGNTVHSGDTVTIVISRGPESTEVPPVVGLSEEDAKDSLKSCGFSVTVSTAYSNDVPEGHVISQSIAGGKSATPGTTIKIVVSLGPEKVAYSFSTVISVASDVYKEGHTYTVSKALVEIYANDGTLLYSTTVSSFPKDISINDIPVEAGNMKITWTYVNVEDSSDSFTEVEQKSVSFSKQ